MRILIIVPYFYPAIEFGGPVTVTKELSEWLSKKGVEVKILTTDAQSPTQKRKLQNIQNLEKISVHRMKNFSNYLSYYHRLFLPRPPFKEIKRLVEWADVIHIHDLFAPLHLIAYRYIKKYKKPYIITPHGTLDPVRLKQSSFPKKVLWKLGIKRLLLEAKLIHALNKDEEKEIQNSLSDNKLKTVLIPNAVSRIKTKKSLGKEFKKKNNIKKSDILISYLGRVDKQKGLDNLIEIFAEICKVKNNVTLVLAGPDFSFSSKLKLLSEKLGVRDKVKLVGTIRSNGEKEKFFSATDIFTYPSLSEGFSVAIIEALSAGTPVIITKECKFDEVSIAKAGFVASSKNEFRKAVVTLLDNDNERKHFAKNALKLSCKFTWKKIGPQYKRLYAKLM